MDPSRLTDDSTLFLEFTGKQEEVGRWPGEFSGAGRLKMLGSGFLESLLL